MPNVRKKREPSDSKRKPSSYVFRLSIGLLGIGLAAMAGAGATWIWWQSAIAPTAQTASENHQSQKIQVQIPQGTSAQQIGLLLQKAGLIRSQNAWKLWTRWSLLQDPQAGFQAGTYQLSAQDPLDTIAQTIWTGKVLEDSFTIPEGWSMKQMAQYFETQEWFTAAEFLEAAEQVDRERYPWLPKDIPFLEGFLYPDTYQIPTDQRTPKATINVMLQRFEQIALSVYEQQPENRPSLLDWVTLASIVEQESVVDEERTEIAGVFWNRLRQGITLGADPTVEYGLGITQTPDQPLTYAQVKRPSPYNTYINPGLPPTPIASPGIASLKATLNPAATDNLYFVARYDGTHVFSRTLTEHERAVASIRKQRNAQ
ncbi:MAG: endolytic transglycosylase MltG [Cyanobacteria bacterium P01_A01_bin.17]